MITIIAMILTIVGALNWLLVGVFNFNLVTFIFGASIFTAIVYVLVGLAGIWLIYFLIKYKFNSKDINDNIRKY